MTAKSTNTKKTDLEDVVSRNLEDVKQLESQIRGLLKTMQSTGSIEKVPSLSLPETKVLREGTKPEVRMEWQGPEELKRQRRGKNFPEEMAGCGFTVPITDMDEGLTDCDIIEMCIREQAAKYRILEESVFFTSVLDRCVFGMTLLNTAEKKLRKPSITLSILLLGDQEKRKASKKSFHYTVQVDLKDVNPVKVKVPKSSALIPFQDTWSDNGNQPESVMPGCEVLLTANFPYPGELLEEKKDFSLLASVTLDDKELWARQIPITQNHFNAANIDSVFKKHHVSILNALGVHREFFKLERLAVENERSPHRSLEKFLFPLGYENISSYKTGIDTLVEIYAINQPSFFWGTNVKIEKCSRKLNSIRCQISTRTTEQIQLFCSKFKNWLGKEVQKDRQSGMSGLIVTSLNSTANLAIQEKVEKEVQLIQKLSQVRSGLKKEKESGTGGKWKTESFAKTDCNIDPYWIQEYSSCVAETDTSFIL